MSRPRKVSDDEVFAAAFRVMQRVGPAEFTLEAIAREAGVTAGALVQRFGSKKQLQLALARSAAQSGPEFVETLRARHRSPLAALRAYADCMADLATTPSAFARNLAYLQEDLSDPDLHDLLEAQGRATRDVLRAIVADAIRVKELPADTRPGQLTRLIEAVVSGSLMTWAFYRRGTAKAWLRRDLNAVLFACNRPRRDTRRRGDNAIARQ